MWVFFYKTENALILHFLTKTLKFDQKEETILRVSLWALFKKQKWLKIAIV